MNYFNKFIFNKLINKIMIFINTHKDFDFNIHIYKENYNEYSIICREKLNNDYPINIIYDNDNILNKYSNLYGDMTYHYYVYKHINEFDNNDIIGFIQYQKHFSEDILNNYKEYIKKYDVILYIKWDLEGENLISNFNIYHGQGKLLKNIIDLIYQYKPSYRSFDLYNINYIIPHNMYIMKKQDYIEFCKFMFWCYELINIKYNIYKQCDNIDYLRLFSFLGERLSTIFYTKHFKNKKILYSYKKIN